MSIIQIQNVTKTYQLGQLASVRDSLNRAWARVCGQSAPKRKPFHALEDISFSVEPGEVVGIIGTNGAGKSTLLKLLSGISTPTSGSIRVGGTIAPLIEVGAGLHPELTGRENVFLNGSILGVSRSTIKKRLDDIVSFAELEEFIDTPVKRYSSGMKVRLGFSIATSMEADILVVDEVLAVGDLAFQRKCFNRMEKLIRQSGKTVLLVSHNMRQVSRMCSRVILLNEGSILADGDAEEVCNVFFERSNVKIVDQQKNTIQEHARIKASGEVFINSVDILDKDMNVVSEITSGDKLHIVVRFHANCFLEQPEFVVGTHTTDFVYLTANSTACISGRRSYEPGDHEINCTISTYPIKPGTYCVRVAIFDKYRRLLFTGDTLKVFSVRGNGEEVLTGVLRLFDFPVSWGGVDSLNGSNT